MTKHSIHASDPAGTINANCPDCLASMTAANGVCHLCGALVQPTLADKHLEFHDELAKQYRSNIAQWDFLADTIKATTEWWKRVNDAGTEFRSRQESREQ